MRVYWTYWAIIASALAIFLLVSPFLPPTCERIELPKVTASEDTLLRWKGSPLVVQIPPPLFPASGIRRGLHRPDTAVQKVLLVGDSMIEWFRYRLARWCREAGYALYTVIWPSSNLIWWGKSDTLAAFIRQYQPTYVLICVGSNELLIPHIHRRKVYLERILGQIGSIPYVWIGPPNWQEDTGINQLISETVGAGRFFDSRRITMERLEDGAHPVPSAAYRWADSVVVFLRDSALVPLSFPIDPPKGKTALPNETQFLAAHAP
ncbi:MAG: hypothetical protein RMJ66_02695 [Bacteroidia bacterium]|nr:hypothetical protein [Bacteroidia bacterium]MDW8133954.1 hypothetical protein [Bacteroidia bacterium]